MLWACCAFGYQKRTTTELRIPGGLQQKVKPAGDSDVRVCPNCHNASVFSAKKSEWFTLFFIPLIPFSSKRVWVCQICRWIAPHAAGQFEPAVAHGVFIQPSYQPGY
uniref:Zinc-ribbon 15 domain-containing protein n=1 Tax=Mycena chlorophos TaxID=658473 RepID=A0ABQ0M8T2_MYCCL|nr:predicted protein [Mycena chlorophos]